MNKKYQSVKNLSIFAVLGLISFGLLVSHTALAGTATLNWNANAEPDLAGYRIYYGTSQRTGTDPKICGMCGYSTSVSVGNVLTYIFNNLTDGLTYYFSVSAYDASNNESVFSGQVSKVIPVPVVDTTAPTVPASLTATAVSSSQINLSWTASTDAVGVTGYRIYRAGTQIATSATNSYSNTGLTASTAYSYTVSAYDAAGNVSAQSSSASATTQAAPAPDTTAPSIPANLSATAISSSQINLSWTASTDAVGVSGYRIYRGGTQIATTTATTYSNTGLSPSTSYSYTVSAYDAAGNVSGQSTSASATTQTISTSTQTIIIDNSDPSNTFQGNWHISTYYPNYYGSNYLYSDNQANLWYEWHAATLTPNTAYQVYARWTTSSGSDRPTNVSYQITGTSQGTITVSNVNQNQNGGQWNLLGAWTFTSASASVRVISSALGADGTCADAIQFVPIETLPDTASPSVPTGLTATTISSSQINLSWTASTDAVGVTGYRIYRAGTQIATSATNSYSNTGLTASTAYSYTVSAYDAAGNVSAQSSSASATTQALLDATPPILSIGSPSGVLSSGTTLTTLSLSTNENATCRYSTVTGTSYSLMTNTFSTTGLINHSTTVMGLSGGQSYNYYIRCQDTASAPNANATDYSISFSIASPADTVAPVISVISSSTTTDSATIAFTTNEPADTQIEYGLTTSYGSTTTLNTTLVTTHSQNISGLSPNITYNYRVTTKDASNNTATSQNYTFITQSFADTQGPSTITDLSISNIGQTHLTLSWTVPSDISGITIYDIRYSASTITNSNFNSATQVSRIPILATSGAAQSQYVSVGLTPGTTYYFAIKSKDSLNNTSNLSNIPSGTTQSATIISSGGGAAAGIVYQLSDTQSPSYPTDTKINSFSGQISLSWVNPADPDFIRVKILRKTDSYPTSPDDGATVYDGNQTTFTDINLQNNQIYYYTMYAYDGVPNYSAPVKLLSVPLTALTQTAAIAPQQPASIIQHVFSENLSLGIKNGESVKALQQILYLENVYPKNIVSGNFGPLTKKAVVAFQKKYGISPASGFVGSLTRAKLNEIYGQNLTPSQKLVLTITLKRGSKLSQVKTLQEMLSKDKTIYSEQLVTGYFGPATQKAVIRFQQKYNITPALGIVGPLTRAKMNEVYGK